MRAKDRKRRETRRDEECRVPINLIELLNGLDSNSAFLSGYLISSPLDLIVVCMYGEDLLSAFLFSKMRTIHIFVSRNNLSHIFKEIFNFLFTLERFN